MLLPGDFSVGHIGDVTTNLTLLLPRGPYDEPVLITRASGSPYAIFLGQHKFTCFECTNNNSWGGILIPNVSIEIDEESVFDTEVLQSPLGTLVRSGTQLDVVTQPEGGFRRPIKTPLIVDLKPCSQNMAAGFAKWRVILGEGMTKRELKRVEISNKAAD